MKKLDWADKKATSVFWSLVDDWYIAKTLRAVERRGFMRAVKLLRSVKVDPETNWQSWADWLEKRK